ncbi:MAG: hypothetical protein M1829_005854 [Trizodia sp. TS-e1964]|nr:MAG: hypothetical protein M1829_005854 [Trizodia sp. TS-e1964]
MLNPAHSSEFPRFTDGDVIVAFQNGNVYQLNSTVLRASSTAFKDLLHEKKGANLSNKAKKDGKVIRYWLELDRSLGGSGRFYLKKLDDQGRCINPGLRLDGINNGSDLVYKHYDTLFKAFYNIPPDLNDVDMCSVLQDCVGLVDIAEGIGATKVISESVDIALLRQGQTLFQSIASNATAWSILALRIKSPSIMTESLIHLIGQWNSLCAAEIECIPEVIRETCVRKNDELRLLKTAMDIRILGHYPRNIQREKTANPTRMNYCNDIYSWMMLSLFRQWYAQCIAEGRSHTALDGGADLYRMVWRAGNSYLDREAMESFHSYFPMSSKGVSCLENHLSQIKDEVKEFLEDLVVNRSQLDIDKHPVAHLTCVVINRSDLPWYKPIATSMERSESIDSDNTE